MQTYSYNCPTRAIFGPGTHQQITDVLPEGAKRVLLVTGGTATASSPVSACLERAGLHVVVIRCAGEPTVSSIDAALDTLKNVAVDAVVACGGGAVIDTGKAVRFAISHNLKSHADLTAVSPIQIDKPCRLPCIALPTTAGTGAEVTANVVVGVPDVGAKISLRGRGLFPTVAIVDPDLMRGAPAGVVLNAGLDAVTQIFESDTSNAATPFSRALTQSLKSQALPALRRVVEDDDSIAWSELAWISHVSGVALANSGLGAAHGLASVIGGRFDAPHGAICGRLLVPVLRQNLLRAPEGSDVHAKLYFCVMEVPKTFAPTTPGDPLSGFAVWIDAQELPRLSDWGVNSDDLATLATQGMAASSSQKNAVKLSKDDYLQILQTAF